MRECLTIEVFEGKGKKGKRKWFVQVKLSDGITMFSQPLGPYKSFDEAYDKILIKEAVMTGGVKDQFKEDMRRN